MKKLLASALLAFVFLAPPANAETICPPGNSYSSFMEFAFTIPKIKVYELNAEGRELWLAKVNKERLEQKLFPYIADRISIGIMTLKGQISVGIVLFYDDCVLPGTVVNWSEEKFDTFTEEAGLKMYMLVPIKSASNS